MKKMLFNVFDDLVLLSLIIAFNDKSQEVYKYYKTKLESVSLSCKSHCSKTANIKILSANSKHIS